MLVEIDTRTLDVSRHFVLTKGKEMGMTGAPPRAATPSRWPATTWAGTAWSRRSRATSSCSPTWAQPSRRRHARLGRVQQDRARSSRSTSQAWTLVRRIPAGPGRLQPRRHARRHEADRHEQARPVGLGDRRRDAARSSREFRRRGRSCTASRSRTTIATRSSRSRASGSQPGTVDVIDLATLAKVASVDVGQQAGGIDFWKSESARP